jgi:hypothetical protein
MIPLGNVLKNDSTVKECLLYWCYYYLHIHFMYKIPVQGMIFWKRKGRIDCIVDCLLAISCCTAKFYVQCDVHKQARFWLYKSMRLPWGFLWMMCFGAWLLTWSILVTITFKLFISSSLGSFELKVLQKEEWAENVEGLFRAPNKWLPMFSGEAGKKFTF